jgi:hypothetical protein
MINHKDAKGHIVKELNRLNDSECHEWGWRKFSEWKKIIQPEAGFLKNNAATFEVKIKADSAKGLNPNFPKICDTITLGTPAMLKTSGATLILGSQKQCDTLRFRIYLVGSYLEAKQYICTLSIMNKTGEQKYIFQGKVFTLDKDDPVEGSVFMMGIEDAKKFCDEKSNFDVNITQSEI